MIQDGNQGYTDPYVQGFSDKRIWMFMALDEIIRLTFENCRVNFPRELKQYIMSFYPLEKFIIEETYRGKITNNGLTATTTSTQG